MRWLQCFTGVNIRSRGSDLERRAIPKTLLIVQVALLLCQFVIVSAVIEKRSALDLQRLERIGNDHRSTEGWSSESFELHGRIFPTYHCPRTKRALRSSSLDDDEGQEEQGRLLNRRGRHRERLTIQYGMHGDSMTLDLTLNENIIPGGYSFVHQTPEGKDIVDRIDRDAVELCHYEGTVRERPGSRVAISTCNGAIDGVIYERNETYLIEYHNNTHLLYRRRFKRDIHDNELSPEGSLPEGIIGNKTAFSTGYRENADSLFVELALVVDRTLFLKFSSNVQRVHQHCLSLVNILNELYRPLNIYITLVGVVLWNTRDNIIISTDSKQTLTSFLAYRRDQLLRQIPNDNAHLLTAVRFPDGVIGKAELGSMCSTAGSGGIAVVENFVVPPLATTIAHEMGHNFNIDHDSEECGGSRCPGPGPCIMEAKLPDSNDIPNRWSACSVDDLKHSLRQGLGSCLRNKPTRMLVRAVCGNGLLEPGEQCDCGRRDSCDNSCCDARTCQLRSNATCATGACCDLDTCQPKLAGSVCRGPRGECDLPEYCDGQSELCPRDVYRRDTSPCKNGEAYCYRGKCHTRDGQCQRLWGSTARSGPDVCFETNVNGTVFGNCGNDLSTDKYVNCAEHDVHCGLLHCTHRNEKLEYGVEAYAKRTATKFQRYGPMGIVRTTVCHAVIVDLGLDVVNPGLVPDGTKCGTGRMCYQQRCMAISRLQEEQDIGDECPLNCSGNGVCNSEGHCHCNPGFAPPFCDEPGDGGSIDSGPAGRASSNMHELLLKVFVPAMTVGVILLMLSLVLLIVKWTVVMAQLRVVLKRFRERKYGHIVVPPGSPTAVVAPTTMATIGGTRKGANEVRRPPVPPPPPIPDTKQAQHFINVNISNNGKITIENKLIDSPFLHKANVVDTHEAFRMRMMQERSYSVESATSSEHPLVTAETHKPSQPNTPEADPEAVRQGGRVFGSVLQELKQTDRMHTFQSHRSKSDERPSARQLPKLPRQHTISDFDAIERLPDVEEEEPQSKPSTPKPIAIPRPLPRVIPGTPARLLPATPTPGTGSGNKLKPFTLGDRMQVPSGATVSGKVPAGTNVAALKAKLNLSEIGARR